MRRQLPILICCLHVRGLKPTHGSGDTWRARDECAPSVIEVVAPPAHPRRQPSAPLLPPVQRLRPHPAIAAPKIGATRNTHTCPSASGPANTAAAIDRAGFTDVLLTGMLIRWTSVSVKPMASGATALYSLLAVTERMTATKTAVRTISVSRTAPRPKPPGRRRRSRWRRSRSRGRRRGSRRGRRRRRGRPLRRRRVRRGSG